MNSLRSQANNVSPGSGISACLPLAWLRCGIPVPGKAFSLDTWNRIKFKVFKAGYFPLCFCGLACRYVRLYYSGEN